MRPLILSTVKLAMLGLALITLGMDHTALAQQSPAIVPGPAAPPAQQRQAILPALVPPPAQQSPVIAPVPIIPALPKPEESASDRLPKRETSAQTNTRQATPVPDVVYDVGVIPGTGWCPTGSDLIQIYMDDEDHHNANSHSGWIGAIVSDNNTRFLFCRFDGTKFGPAEGAYAVLKLSAQCPPGSFSFSRYFENEHNSNENGSSGNIYPNSQSETATGTHLYFCLFVPNPLSAPTPFPDLGLEYGVLASSLPTSGLASGHLHTDDEDDGNGNFFDIGYYSMGSWTTQIIWGSNNTDISIVKVKNKPPPPPHCLPKVVSYNGTLLSASYDGANCFIKPVVAGATPFIWSGGYYVTADKSATCLPGTGSWDTANCYFMPKPTGGFLYNDAFYLPAGPGNTCPLGGTFDGANCLVKAAPWGTHAFEYQNKWYFTPLFTCKDGGYDSANCYIMKAPAGHMPFIYSNNFYYQD